MTDTDRARARKIVEAAFDEANHAVVLHKTKHPLEVAFYKGLIPHIAASLAAVTRERDAAMAVVEAARKARICLAARGIAARREARTVLMKALAAHDATTAPTPDQGGADERE